MALVGTYLAAFCDYSKHLAPGERGLVAVIAADREQAQVIIGYIKGFFDIPLLKHLVAKDVNDGLELKNGISIRVMTTCLSSRRRRSS